MSEDRPPAGAPIDAADTSDPRRRARMAISELFLDTALDERAFVRLRDELRSSGLSLDALDEIYYDEVAPVLHQNLNTPAGVWSGFDAAWLDREIQKRGRRQGFALLNRLRRYVVTRSTITDWNRLRALVADAR